MADGMPRRTSTQLNLALRLGVLALLVAAGCGGEPGGGDAASTPLDTTAAVDETELPDSLESTKAACEAQNSDCVTAYWANSGTCNIEIKEGATCGSGPAECRGSCTAEGKCVGPGAQKACGLGEPDCSRCNGNGSCSFYVPGAACKILAPKPCRASQGACAAFGVCAELIDVGASCTSAASTCGEGICDAAGECVPLQTGAQCQLQTPSNCMESTGVCGLDGKCTPVPKPVGTPCPIAKPGSCMESVGLCGEGGVCSPVPQAKGVPCKLSSSGPCAMACDGTGICAVEQGLSCQMTSGPCAGKPGVCNVAGYCAPSGPCGQEVAPKACGDFALGQSCDKNYTNPSYPGQCSALSPFPTANSNSCGDAGDPCQPKMCSDGPKAWAICTPGQLPDGAPCPGIAANPCSLAKCAGGKCQQAFKPAGTPCTPLAPKQCGPHGCDAAGECAAVAPTVPLSGACTLTDDDTDCWAKSCDSAGNCQKIPRPAGEACGIVADDACTAHKCNGKGACVPELKSETALCAHNDCLLPTAKPMSPCPVDPCVNSACMKLGLCKTTYKPTGASCEIKGMAGACSESHQCVLPSKSLEIVAGNVCIGHFPCMKEDVAIGQDGVCHGTFATGGICGTPCRPGICGADGTCQLSLAPTGTTCGATDDCGKLECDGKGECGFPAASVGTTCGKPSWPQLAECQQYACNAKGQCLTAAAVGNSCKSASPCLVGTCNKDAKCEFAPISGPVCDLAKPDPCNTGLCKAGTCEPVPKPGASCESTGTCTKGVCDAAGKCGQVIDPGAKCASKKQCMEGVCSATGACEFSPRAAGSQCLAVGFGTDWDCYTGACDGKGGCTLKVNTGAKCLQGESPCKEGVCQSDASCKAVPANLGKACSNGCMADAVCTPTGECKGTPTPGKTCYNQCFADATCSAQGECKGVAKVGQLCFGPPKSTLCQSSMCNSEGNCVKSNKAAGTPCEVGAAGYGEVASYACGSKTGTCNGGVCVPAFTDPDGTPCGTDDGCAEAHVCKAGLCLPVEPKPNGTPCKYGCASGICTAGGCISGYGMDFGGGPCDDGDVCTFDYCAGAPLPGLKPPAGMASAPSGQCFTMQNNTACPLGKPPNPTPKCLTEGCPVNECGIQLTCQNAYNSEGDYYCVQSKYNTWIENPPGCKNGNPCAKVSCTSQGTCSYQPFDYYKQCGAFKYCKGMECVPME